MKKCYKTLLPKIRRVLLKTSLEQWLSFGVKSSMPQKQIMVVYAGYSLLGTILLMYIGRVGVITFGNAILVRREEENLTKEKDIAV